MASTAQSKIWQKWKIMSHKLHFMWLWNVKKKKERNQQCLKLHTGNVVSGYIEKLKPFWGI